MFGTIINYFRVKKLLLKIYDGERIEKNLTKIFGVECKRDWVGRLYMVVNPILQNMEDGGNTLIFDRDNKVMIEGWVMKNLELIRNFVINNSMFDLLTYSIDRIDDDDNYLIVFKNIYFDDMMRIVKWSAATIIVGLLTWLGFVIF